MKKILILVLSCIMTFSMFASGSKEGDKSASDVNPIILKMAENQPENNPVTVAMYLFADLVKEKTNGEVIVDLYASAQLGQETENIEQISAGILDLARVNSVTLAQVIPELGVFTLPYIFTDQEVKYKILDGPIGQEVLDVFSNYGMISFGYLEAGSRSFYTVKKPVRSLEDLKGQKIRVQKAKITIDMANLVGAVATPMNYGEVYSALQTGVIDGAENDFVSYYTSGHYEVARHYTMDGHLSPPALIIMSQKAWDSLNDSQKKAVREAADEATIFERKAMNEKQDEFRAKVEESGCVIYEVDTKPFQDAIAPIYDEYPQYADIISRIKEVK